MDPRSGAGTPLVFRPDGPMEIAWRIWLLARSELRPSTAQYRRLRDATLASPETGASQLLSLLEDTCAYIGLTEQVRLAAPDYLDKRALQLVAWRVYQRIATIAELILAHWRFSRFCARGLEADVFDIAICHDAYSRWHKRHTTKETTEDAGYDERSSA